jgi:hypothetical protein
MSGTSQVGTNVSGASNVGTNIGGSVSGAGAGAGAGGAGGDLGVGTRGGGGAGAEIGAGASSEVVDGGVDSMQASSGFGGGANVDVSDASSVSGDASHGMTQAESNVGSGKVEAGFYNEVGPEGKGVVKGGAVGTGEAHLESEISGHEIEGRRVAYNAGEEHRRGANVRAEGAVSATGYQDPEAAAARAEGLEWNERDRAMGRVGEARDQGAAADAAVDDPSGTARRAAHDAGARKVQEAAPGVTSKANVASDAVKHPVDTATGHVEGEIVAEVRIDPSKKK